MGRIWTAVALGFLLVCDLLLFRNALVEGKVYFRSDTVTYYFPIADRLTDVLREGKLLLWTRHIFGGFPLFADGEAGMLYPPNLLAYLLMPEHEAFVWLRIARHFMAAAFTFGYLRVLQLDRFAATVGALTFAFGSFMVTQMHHTNVTNTAIWLPLTLAMVELAVRHVGRWRWLYATGAGVSVGIQALGLHIQPLLMSGFFLAVYVPFRVLLCPIAWPVRKAAYRSRLRGWVAGRLSSARVLLMGANLLSDSEEAGASPTPTESGATPAPASARVRRWVGAFLVKGFHRTVLACLLLGLIPAIAFGIAAAQVLPLVELGFFSFRGPGVTYQFATSYSMPVHNLVNLLFPYFFRYT
ncbi:MAG: hypothetical protein ACYC3V_20845, partial [Chloroflexota bacterium]